MAAVSLTKEGFKKIEEELKNLQKNVLPDIKKRMANAREDGDLSENNAWITAKEEMEITRMRMIELRTMLKEAVLVEEKDDKTPIIKLGDEVVLQMNGNKMTVKLVPTMEADPVTGKISEESPLGKHLIGKKPGDKVNYPSPAGEQEVTIVSKK